MKTYRADIYFQDEAPRLGCGWRRCEVKIGRRWLRLTECATGRRQRLPLKMTVGHRVVMTLDLLKPRPVPPP